MCILTYKISLEGVSQDLDKDIQDHLKNHVYTKFFFRKSPPQIMYMIICHPYMHSCAYVLIDVKTSKMIIDQNSNVVHLIYF